MEGGHGTSYSEVRRRSLPTHRDITTSDVLVDPASEWLIERGQSGHWILSGSSSVDPDIATATSGTLSVTAQGSGTITVSRYNGNPVGSALAGATSFFDVGIGPGSSFTSVTFTDCDPAGGATIDWWAPNSQEFVPVENETVPIGSPPCITVTIDKQSYSPNLIQLSGTVFATVGPTSTPVGTAATAGSTTPVDATIPVDATAPVNALASTPPSTSTGALAFTGFVFLPLLLGGGGLVVGGTLIGYRRRHIRRRTVKQA